MLIKWKDLSFKRKILAISMLCVCAILTGTSITVWILYSMKWLACLLSFLSTGVSIGAYFVSKTGRVPKRLPHFCV